MIFIGGRNLYLSMLCNVTPPVGLNATGKFGDQATLEYGPTLTLILITLHPLKPIF